MRSPAGLFIFVVVMLLLDLYVFQAIKMVAGASRFRTAVYVSFWVIALFSVAGFTLFVFAATIDGEVGGAVENFHFDRRHGFRSRACGGNDFLFQ